MPEGDLAALKSLLNRVLEQPNNLQQNLRDAAACERGVRRLLTAACLPKPFTSQNLWLQRESQGATQPCRLALAGLPTTEEVEKAKAIGRDVFEYVQQIDYDKVGADRAAPAIVVPLILERVFAAISNCVGPAGWRLRPVSYEPPSKFFPPLAVFRDDAGRAAGWQCAKAVLRLQPEVCPRGAGGWVGGAKQACWW